MSDGRDDEGRIVTEQAKESNRELCDTGNNKLSCMLKGATIK